MAAHAALGDQALVLGVDERHVAGLVGRDADPECGGVALGGRRHVLLDEIALLRGQDGLDHRLLHAVVGGVERGRASELLELPGNVLEDELLRRRQPALTGGVGRRDEIEVHAVLVAFRLHDVTALCEQELRHVARKRVVDEVLRPHLLRVLDDRDPARRLVGLDRDVARFVDDVRILVGSDEADQDVGAHLANLARRGHRARDRLADDDDLDLGVGGEPGELGDDGLELAREIVGIGHVLHATRILAAGHDADLERPARGSAGGRSALLAGTAEGGERRDGE